MKKTRIVRVLFLTSVVLAISVGTALAEGDVQPRGIVTDVTAIKDTVQGGETAMYNVSVSRITDGAEYVNFSIEPKRNGWTYGFDPNGFYLNSSGETKHTILSITPPTDAASGDYYHDLNATAYFPGLEWLGVAEFSVINVSTNVTGPGPTPTPPTPTPPPIGGTAVPVSKFSLLAPWIALAAVLVSAVVATVVLGRHKKKRL